jgi:Tol biopolymer transport system component
VRVRIAASLVLLAAALVVTQTSATAETTRRNGWIVYWAEGPWPSIWALPPSSSRGHRILRNKQNAKRPRLAPGRAWVAFDGAAPGKRAMSDFDIQIVHLDGTGLRTLTNSLNWDVDAQWSPDGKLLAFTRSAPSPTDCSDGSIWVMRSDGSDAHRVVANACGERWSPDGKRFVYEAGDGDLYVVNVDGTDRHRLLKSRLPETPAGWSARGKILFTRNHDDIGRIADVLVMNADGTGVRRLGDGFAGGWSPSGRQILYTRSFFSALFVMNADGSHKHRISRRVIAGEPDWR